MANDFLVTSLKETDKNITVLWDKSRKERKQALDGKKKQSRNKA